MGGAGLRRAACLSQDPPSPNPSHQPPPARFISCNKSNHPQIQSPPTTPRLPILSKPTVSTNCCWNANSRHRYNYTTTSVKRN